MFARAASLAVVLTASVAVWLLIQACTTDKPLRVVSLDTMHAYVYTSDHETFSVPVLLSSDSTPYAYTEGIVRTYVESSCGRERVPVTLIDIHHEGTVRFRDEAFMAMAYELKIAVVIQDGLIAIDEAELVLESVQAKTLRVPMGAFYYHFDMEDSPRLALYDRHNVHAEPFGMPTSVGVVFRLRNTGATPLEVHEVSLGGAAVQPDMRAFRRHEGEVNSFLSIDALLGRTYDALSTPRSLAVTPRLMPGETGWFFVPFAYQRPLALHRYPLIITYQSDGELHRLVGDDFLAIRTPLHGHESLAHREVIEGD